MNANMTGLCILVLWKKVTSAFEGIRYPRSCFLVSECEWIRLWYTTLSYSSFYLDLGCKWLRPRYTVLRYPQSCFLDPNFKRIRLWYTQLRLIRSCCLISECEWLRSQVYVIEVYQHKLFWLFGYK